MCIRDSSQTMWQVIGCAAIVATLVAIVLWRANEIVQLLPVG